MDEVPDVVMDDVFPEPRPDPLTHYSGNIPVLHISEFGIQSFNVQNPISTKQFGNVIVRTFTEQMEVWNSDALSHDDTLNRRVKEADVIRYGQREVIHSSMNQHHPHIMHICAFLYDRKIITKNKIQPYINAVAIENAPKGSVQEYMKELTTADKKLSNQQIFSWALQLARVMNYCHSVYKIMHRDIRPANVFVFENGDYLKLGTFRMAKEVTKNDVGHSVLRAADFLYCAPETIERDDNLFINYGYSADVWSYGMFLYEITHNRPPFKNGRHSADYFRKSLEGGLRPSIDENVHVEFCKLIKECWRLEKPEESMNEKRPTFNEIVDRLESLNEFNVKTVP